jgi:hypothetical protein
MKQSRTLPGSLGVVLLLGNIVAIAGGIPPRPQQTQRNLYSTAQLTAYGLERDAKDQARISLLDDFVAKYPKSVLLPYIYKDYYQTYYGLKNYPRTIEYVDKVLKFGNKLDLTMRLEALVVRAQTFVEGSSEGTLQTSEANRKAHRAAAQGLKTLSQWQKPQSMRDEVFVEQKSKMRQLFNSVTVLRASR